MGLWDSNPPTSGPAVFLNKIPISCPNNSALDLLNYWLVEQGEWAWTQLHVAGSTLSPPSQRHWRRGAMITGSERPHWVLPPRWETLTPRRLSQQGNLSINHTHSVSSCRLWDICWSSWIWEKKETSKQSEEGREPEVEELFSKRTLDTLQSYSRLTGIVCGLGYFSRWSICILTAISWGQNALSRKKPLFLPKTPPQAWVTVPPIAWGRRGDHCCCPR